MTYLKRNHLSTLSIASVLLLSACGGGGGSSSGGTTPVVDRTPPVIVFAPSTLTVASGTTGSAATNTSGGVASTLAVSCTNGGDYNFASDLFTAADVTVNTTSVCTATIRDAAGNQGSARLTVTMTPPPPPDTTAPVITFDPPTLTVASGSTATATLTVADPGGVSATPTAVCTNGGAYNVISGVFTPAADLTEDTTSVCTISVTDDAGNAGSGELTVTMTPAPAVVTVTLSGTLTYDRVPVDDDADGLNYDDTVEMPIRQVPVDLLNAANTVLQSTVSDDNGNYSFEVDSGEDVRIQVRAEVQRDDASEVDLQVVDNTSGDSLYALRGAVSEVPTQDQTRDLHAASGWGGFSYTATRAAAPFALLDTVYGAMEDFIAVDPDVDFPPFDIQWSTLNRAESGNPDRGEIVTSSFTFENRGTNAVPNFVPVLRILGDANNDTDEYDVHVVVHEFGHYFENSLSRSDSTGGVHGFNDRLDPRLAFGEGWGNALSGMILDNPNYRDTRGTRQGEAGGFSLESNTFASSGWYSESSVQSILYDLFDGANDGADTASFGLAPIYGAFVDPAYKDTEAFTTIFAFLEALENQPGVNAAQVTALTDAQLIFGTTKFGLGETNTGGLTGAVPVYLPLPTNATRVPFCSFDNFSIFNKHGNRRYFEFNIPSAGEYRFNVARDRRPSADSGTANSDPDFIIYKDGQIVGVGGSGVNNAETLDINLSAGQHVMEAFSFDNFDTENLGITSAPDANPGDTCYTMSLEAQ